jgi:hypothetical protein
VNDGINTFCCIFKRSGIQYITRYPFYIAEYIGRNKERNFFGTANGPYGIAFLHQFFYNVSADETRTAGDKYFS